MLRRVKSPVTSHQSSVKSVLFIIISSVLLILPFFSGKLWIFAWVGFVSLFFAIRDQSKARAFLLAYLGGIIFWFGTIYWLIHVTLLGLILLVLYLALYFGIFGLFFRYAIRNTQYAILNIITIPASWILLEYIRSQLITGFPWALLGYSQYLNLPIIQIADITGVWGVSFLIMLVNVAIYQIIDHRSEVIGKTKKNNAWINFTLTIFCVLVVFTYGLYKLYLSPKTRDQRPIRISLIQGNIPQSEKWDEACRDLIMERYISLTKKAAKDSPDLIIWPETAIPGVIDEEPELLARVLKLAKNIKTPILIGTVTTKTDQRPKTKDQIKKIEYYNSAVLISPAGKILQQYDKLHLVPFGEYVPLERYFPFFRRLIGTPIGDFTAGRENTIFELIAHSPKPKAQFAVLICFEDFIPELAHKFVKNGARFLVNITNDAWFMKSTAPYQHAQASVFRAVENRVPVVRAANTGLSCFINQYGRIYDKVSDGKKAIFVLGYKTRDVELR